MYPDSIGNPYVIFTESQSTKGVPSHKRFYKMDYARRNSFNGGVLLQFYLNYIVQDKLPHPRPLSKREGSVGKLAFSLSFGEGWGKEHNAENYPICSIKQRNQSSWCRLFWIASLNNL